MPISLTVTLPAGDLSKKISNLETQVTTLETEIDQLPKPYVYIYNSSTTYTPTSTADNREFSAIHEYHTYPFYSPSWLQNEVPPVTPILEPLLEFRGGTTEEEHMEHLTEVIHHFLWKNPTKTISIFPLKTRAIFPLTNPDSDVIIGYRVGVLPSDVTVGQTTPRSSVQLPDGTEGTFSFMPIVCAYSPRVQLDG